MGDLLGVPSKPCLHLHTKLPSVFAQSVLAPQLFPPSVHSLISRQPGTRVWNSRLSIHNFTKVDPERRVARLAGAGEPVGVIVTVGAGGVIATLLRTV